MCLASITRFGRMVAPGFIVIDGALRSKKVYDMKQDGNEDWKREAFAQAVGFGAALVVGAGVAFFIGTVGVGLVVGAITAGAVAVLFDKKITGAAGDIYDRFISK